MTKAESLIHSIAVAATVFLSLLPASAPAEEGPEGDSESSSTVIEGHPWGRVSGMAGMYYERIDQEGDSNLMVPFFEVIHLTPEFFGFSAGAGLMGYLRDVHGEDREEEAIDDAELAIHQLFLNYRLSRSSVRVGRQALDNLLFLDDYYEALSLSSREMEGLTVNAAFVTEVAESDIGKFTGFQNINRNDDAVDDFLAAAELTWAAVPEAAAGTLQYYHHGNLYRLYGLHTELMYSAEDVRFGLYLDGYATDEDSGNGLRDEKGEVHDSTLWHINPLVGVQDVTLSAGYIRAGSAVGARSGGLLDDYFNPFNEGDKLFEPGAQTWYGSLSWESDRFSVDLVLGTTDYTDDGSTLTEKEFDIRAGLQLMENVVLEAEFAVVDGEDPDGNYSILEATLFYEF